MDSIRIVIQYCIRFMNTRLTFSPFSFTILQAFLAIAALSIIISVIRKLLS